MYRVDIHLKSTPDPISLTTTDFDAIAKSLTGSQVIWLDNNSLGIWINPTEIVKILLQRLPDAKTQPPPTNTLPIIEDPVDQGYDSYNDNGNPRCCMEQAMRDALDHQKQDLEG